jgi:hypothetical protein
MKKVIIYVLLVAIAGLTSMCSGNSGQGAGEEKKDRGKGKPPQQKGNVIKFKQYSCVDRQGTGGEAFSFLMPVDWVFDGGITWILDNPGMPATAAMKLTNPRGSEQFELFPNQAFWYTTNQQMLYINPVGSRYFGCEVRPQMNAMQALHRVVLPRFRGNAGNLRVISEQEVPELVQIIKKTQQPQAGLRADADAGKVRVEYTMNGKPMEEEIYTAVESYTYPIQSWGGTVYNTNWTVDYIFSFKAEKGKLDEAAKIFQTIIYSFRVNPNWYNKYTQLVNYLIQRQIQQIHSIGELSRMLAQTSDQIREDNMRQYYEREAIHDKISENFSDYIRGVDRYYDPNVGHQVELPAGYNNAWSNPLGEYIISDDPNYNPNIGSNLHWEQLERK